jgi:segregation and condensation protein A
MAGVGSLIGTLANPISESASPLALDGFDGWALLLARVQAQRIDLAALPLAALIDQLAGALRQPGPLPEKADWVIIAARILLLRSRLLLPARDVTQQDATEAASRLCEGFDLPFLQALAAWLDARPQIGRDVFGRGQTAGPGPTAATVPALGASGLDGIGFLWASIALFDDPPSDPDLAETDRTDQPLRPKLHSVAEASRRIRQKLAATPRLTLAELLPDPAPDDRPVRLISGWTSSFAASLELAKQHHITLQQDDTFGPITLLAATGGRDAA